jgi:hypothetical protein
MARLIVLRFEDDDDADLFTRSTVLMDSKGDGSLLQVFPTVEGMFQAPTKLCDCADRGDGWRHSDKHGWWLHHGCGRPSTGWAENLRAVIRSGKDLTERVSRNTIERTKSLTGFCPECGQSYPGYE